MIMKIQTTVYDYSSNKEVPLWKLNTDTSTVFHFDDEKQKYVCFQFRTRYIEDHIRYTMQTYPERFQKLLDKNEIYSYLDELEIKAFDAVDRQVELWKPSSKKHQIAVEKRRYCHAGRNVECMGSYGEGDNLRLHDLCVTMLR